MAKPIKQIRNRNLSISVFDNSTKDQKRISYVLQKSYLDKDKKWVNTSISLFENDLPILQDLLDQLLK